MRGGMIFLLLMAVCAPLGAVTETLLLENFDSYATGTLTNGAPAYPELTNTQPNTTTYTNESTGSNGTASITTDSALSSSRALALTYSSGGQFDSVVSFPAVTDQYFFMEFYIKVPASGNIIIIGEDASDVDGPTIEFNNGTVDFSGTNSTAYSADTYYKVKFFADQNGGCANVGCYDAYLNDTLVANNVSFSQNWSGRSLSKLTISVRSTAGAHYVDELRLYRSDVAVSGSDLSAPTVSFDGGATLDSLSVNPHLDLSFA